MIDIYNKFDIAIPLFFFAHMVIRYENGKPEEYNWLRLTDNIIEIIIIIGSIIKLLQFIRFKEEYAQFVQMFFKVMINLVPFILLFFSFVTLFCLI